MVLGHVVSTETIWANLRAEAESAIDQESILALYLRKLILDQGSLAEAFASSFAQKLGTPDMKAEALRALALQVMGADPSIHPSNLEDLRAVHARDPFQPTWLQAFLNYKGLTALQAHRVAHKLWNQGRRVLAQHIQGLSSLLLQVDIHPAARLGGGIFMDHATGIVIGETSVVGNDVTIMQSVALGGSGRERGDRHPKIGHGVLIGAGAKLLGNIRIGNESRVAANSVVLDDVPPHSTVAGIPAKVVRGPTGEHPAEDMNHYFSI